MIGWVRHVKYIGERSSSPDVLPTNTLAPSIAGDPYIGETLTATPGTWTGADSVAGEWYVDGAATGDTDTSYTVLLADAGKIIDYRETATNSAGSVTQASNTISIGSLTVQVQALFGKYSAAGAFFSLRDTSTLYSDAARTTPAVAGGPVGGIEDISGSGAHASQATGAYRPGWPSTGPARIRTDFVDDVLACTLATDCEVWVNTPWGHYQSVGHAGYHTLPLNDCTDFIAIGATLSAEDRALIATYFGTPARWGCYLHNSTSVTLTVHSGPETLDFVGANGVATSRSVAGVNQVLDLSTDGLTAPITVMPPATYGAGYFWIWYQGVAGSIPLPVAGLVYFGLSASNLTGSVPDANASMAYYYVINNKLTGHAPNLSAATNLAVAQFGGNQLNGQIPALNFPTLNDTTWGGNNFTTWAGGGVPSTLGYATFGANPLTQATVDAFLAAFVAAGRTSASGQCVLQLNGAGVATPSASGLADKATLISRGWTVGTN